LGLAAGAFSMPSPYWAGIKAAAAALSTKPVPVEVHGSDDLDAAFQKFVHEKVELVFVAQDSLLLSERARLATLATRGLPTMHGLREHVEAGGLICYGINVAENHRRAATLVDKILKGAKAGDLPIELPVRLELLVNLKTANAAGYVDRLLKGREAFSACSNPSELWRPAKVVLCPHS
jgi:putative ABC transport system substrate-binding protein